MKLPRGVGSSGSPAVMGTGPRTTLPLSSNQAWSAASSTHARTVGRHGGTSGTGTPCSRAKLVRVGRYREVSEQRPGGGVRRGAGQRRGCGRGDAGEHDARDEDDDGGHRRPSPRRPVLPGCGALPFLSTGKRATARVGDARAGSGEQPGRARGPAGDACASGGWRRPATPGEASDAVRPVPPTCGWVRPPPGGCCSPPCSARGWRSSTRPWSTWRWRASATDLDAELDGLQWTVNAYTLTLAGLILLGGALGDRYGRRRVFVIGVAWFAVASLLCGVAPNVEMLVAAPRAAGGGRRAADPGSSRSSRRRSGPDGRPPSAPGPGWAGSPARSGRSSAGGWSSGVVAVRSSSSTCRSRAVVVVALRHVPESRDPGRAGRSTSPGRCWPYRARRRDGR